MRMHRLKIYPAKQITLGYITTIDPDSYTIEGQVQKSVMAFRKHKSQPVSLPLDACPFYYSIDQEIPISKKRTRGSRWISDQEIMRIVHQEQQLQNGKILAVESTQTTIQEDPYVYSNDLIKEKTVEKVKKLVV